MSVSAYLLLWVEPDGSVDELGMFSEGLSVTVVDRTSRPAVLAEAAGPDYAEACKQLAAVIRTDHTLRELVRKHGDPSLQHRVFVTRRVRYEVTITSEFATAELQEHVEARLAVELKHAANLVTAHAQGGWSLATITHIEFDDEDDDE